MQKEPLTAAASCRVQTELTLVDQTSSALPAVFLCLCGCPLEHHALERWTIKNPKASAVAGGGADVVAVASPCRCGNCPKYQRAAMFIPFTTKRPRSRNAQGVAGELERLRALRDGTKAGAL